MKKIASLAILGGATLALAACGSSDSASTEATADTVEVPSDEALETVTEEVVEDTAANEAPVESDTSGPPPAPVTQEAAQDAADAAEDTLGEAEAALKELEGMDDAAGAVDDEE